MITVAYILCKCKRTFCVLMNDDFFLKIKSIYIHHSCFERLLIELKKQYYIVMNNIKKEHVFLVIRRVFAWIVDVLK